MAAVESPLEPLGPNIVVKPIQEHVTTPGGIMMPETVRQPTERGEVLAVGVGFTTNEGASVPLQLKVGDVVYYPIHAGGICEVRGVRYRVMSEREVFCRERRATGTPGT